MMKNKYFILFISVFLSAVNYNVFIKPINLVAGGNNGIAILLHFLFKINSSVTVFVLSFILVIFSFIFLGKKDSVASLFVVFLYPFLLEITKNFAGFFSFGDEHVLLLVICAGFLSGIASGIVYKCGLNNGGIGVIAKILYKRFGYSITRVNFIINIIIVLFGAYVFGFEMILFAIVYLYINKLVCDRFLLGVSKNKIFYIFSYDYYKYYYCLKYQFFYDVFVFDIMDKYCDRKMKMIMCVVPNHDYFLLKQKIIDISFKSSGKYPFVLVNDCYEVSK